MFTPSNFSINRIFMAIKRAFSPRLLFANGEQGVWYDPSDFSTLFQDAAGTVPVTAVEQPVGLMLDKSGRGNHATQATATSRPVLKQDANGKYYLLFDGVDDSLATASIDFTATDKMTVFAGITKAGSADTGIVVELSADVNANNGTFYILAPIWSGSLGYAYLSKGTLQAGCNSDLYPTPSTNVLTGTSNIGGDVTQLRVNGTAYVANTSDQGMGNYGNYPLFIGARSNGAAPFNGHLYSLIVRGAQSTDAQITSAEQYVAGKTGVTLP